MTGNHEGWQGGRWEVTGTPAAWKTAAGACQSSRPLAALTSSSIPFRVSETFKVVGYADAEQVLVGIKVGTWNLAPGAGNPTGVGGPGMATGQHFVVKISYDDTSPVSTRNVLTELFTDSGQDMSVIELTGGSNTIGIFVPMAGLDWGAPFIYGQNEANHFPTFSAEPTVNFALGSNVSDPSNIIGVEFEGDFVAGANFNIIEMFNTAADSVAPINEVGQILNCGDLNCVSTLPSWRPACSVWKPAAAPITGRGS